MENKWIDVDKKLPKRGKWVLVLHHSGSMKVMYRPKRSRNGDEHGDDGMSWYPGGLGIGWTTHWMELPALPPDFSYDEII